MLLFAGFGWGKPVQINPVKFKRNISMSKGEAIVSFAGPLMNLILALISTFILGLFFKFGFVYKVSEVASQIIIMFLYELIFMNIGLGVFNLIPIPPLDGSKILRHFLPAKAQIWFDNYSQIFYYLLFVLLLFRKTYYITGPIIKFVASLIFLMVSKILGINMGVIMGLLGLYNI